MEIRNLLHIDFDTLFQGFERAFSDYEIFFEKEEVRSMFKRRGYDPRLSFAAFDNGEIVAFTLNGIGDFNGIRTAYDTGTGTVKEYRGQGIAAKIFTYSLPFLKEAGVRQYVLEVLQNNEKAISVYRKMNFDVSREFDCFRQNIDLIDNSSCCDNCRLMPVETDTVRRLQHCCDIKPSWQNSMYSIERGGSDLVCLGAFIGDRIVGYCVFDENTGDLTQIAVEKECRRKGIASRLLKEASERMRTGYIKVLNIDSVYQPLQSFLTAKNIPLASRQFEMTLEF